MRPAPAPVIFQVSDSLLMHVESKIRKLTVAPSIKPQFEPERVDPIQIVPELRIQGEREFRKFMNTQRTGIGASGWRFQLT